MDQSGRDQDEQGVAARLAGDLAAQLDLQISRLTTIRKAKAESLQRFTAVVSTEDVIEEQEAEGP